jgi:homoserine O-acetyltransferase
MTAVETRESLPSISRPLPRYLIDGPPGAPVIAVLGGISATRHITTTAEHKGWWSAIAGPGRAIDTDRFCVLGFDFLDGGRDESGKPQRVVTTHDQALALANILDAAGIDRIHTFVGSSYGGMVALAFAERFGRRVEQLVIISAAHQPHPMSTALRTLQRRIVELGLETDRAGDALSIARGLAMTTYRTADEFGARFKAAPLRVTANDASFEVDDYLRARGQAFTTVMPPERFLALSLSGDLHSVKPERITVPTTLVAAEGDAIVPRETIDELARRLGGERRLLEISTRVGHDAFLVETEQVSAIVAGALNPSRC